MQIELKCLNCGSNQFENAQNRMFKDGQAVRCMSCGNEYPFEELKKVAVEKAIEQYVRQNKKAIVEGAEPVTDEKELSDIKTLKQNLNS